MASGVGGRKQRRMGPAPFASFEDLSDETDTPGPEAVPTMSTRLPGINEDATPTSRTSTLCLSVAQTAAADGLTPSTPRIDISRASSSSHHEDSRDSTPERELFQPCTRLGLAFKEDGALELRSSTEELDFQEPCEARRSPVTVSVAVTSQSTDHPLHQRKDSQSSDFGGLLSISGRTSRLSSIGSQGSRVSNASHLSVMSGTSRSPSPHKMLLETSFCGSKSENSQSSSGAPNADTVKIVEDELLERVLLSRKHDPTEAILAEGISIECRRKIQPANDHFVKLAPVLQNTQQQSPTSLVHQVQVQISPQVQRVQPLEVQVVPTKIQPKQVQVVPTKVPPVQVQVVPTKVEPVQVQVVPTKLQPVQIQNTPTKIEPVTPTKIEPVQAQAATPQVQATPPEKPVRKIPPPPKRSPKTAVIITVNKPSEDIASQDTITNAVIDDPDLVAGNTIVADSGVEYTFIPLKGPLPKKSSTSKVVQNKTMTHNMSHNTKTYNNTSSAKVTNTSMPMTDNVAPSSASTDYIRIKLKPDHMYTNEPPTKTITTNTTKPATLDLSNGGAKQPAIHPPSSPKQLHSNTPSPSVSRKSSFASLFRANAKEYGTSPESPTVPSLVRKKSPRSRSKSSDRADTSSDKNNPSKHRSVFTLFKTKKSCHKSKQSLTAETSPKPATSLHSLEFTFDRPPVKKYYEVPLDGDSIIIPLHSPTSHEAPVTVSNVCSENKTSAREEQQKPTKSGTGIGTDGTSTGHRQSSTSSENIVFTTNLGSDNEIFTTKLPKRNEILEKKQATPRQVENRKTPPCTPVAPPVTNACKPMHLITSRKVEQQQTIVTAPHVEDEPEVDTSECAAETSEQMVNDGNNDSSESENENLLMKLVNTRSAAIAADDDESSSEHERKGLVLQQDSFEDELPYVPTTLPLERSMAVPIVPVKQRATYEIRTCPIDRPRSTTPINPSCLEDYCEDSINAGTVEKLRISLPREESSTNCTIGRAKSPRRWTEFQPQQEAIAPPLPPRGAPKDWINFEDIPERRKPPKRIQMIPSSRSALHPTTATGTASVTSAVEDAVIYSYVNPEDCKCECHDATGTTRTATGTTAARRDEEDELPLLAASERRSDSSPDSSQPGGQPHPPPPPAKRIPESANAFPYVSKTS